MPSPVFSIGLVGTSVPADWRLPFISGFARSGIVVFDGASGLSDERERDERLACAQVLLAVVTSDALDFPALAELGFLAARAMRVSCRQHLVAHIAPDVSRVVSSESPEMAQASRQIRRQARAWLASLEHPRIHLARSQSEAFEVCVRLWEREG